MSAVTDDKTARLLRAAGTVRPPEAGSLAAAGAGLAAGAVAFIAGLFLAPGATWAGMLANWLFWTGLGLGGVVLPAVFRLTESRWGRVVQRLGAGSAAFLPLTLPLLILVWFGRETLFPGRDFNAAFLRDGLALLIAGGICLGYLSLSLREPSDHRRRLGPMAVLVTAAFFLAGALLDTDLGMSLQAEYHSTIDPVIYLAGSFYAAVGVTAVAAAALARSRDPVLRELVHPCELRDLANLLWGFAIFLAYLWWCRYLIVWMGNKPHEAEHHLLRWRDGPWNALAWASLACAVGVPFLALFSQALKKRPVVLGAAGGIGAMGVLLQQLLDVLPSVPARWGIGALLVQVGLALGFAGAAALAYLWLMRRVPAFPAEDPLFLDELRIREVSV